MDHATSSTRRRLLKGLTTSVAVLPFASSAKERRIDEIGWAKDIREAERLARENNRPVFLFTHDGRINTGRC